MDAGNYRNFGEGADGTLKHEYSQTLMTRPGYSTAGRDVQVRVNQFRVMQWPNKDVYQYDVSIHLSLFSSLFLLLLKNTLTSIQINIGNGAEKMGLIKAVWESRTVQGRLQAIGKDQLLWDGNKIAW